MQRAATTLDDPAKLGDMILVRGVVASISASAGPWVETTLISYDLPRAKIAEFAPKSERRVGGDYSYTVEQEYLTSVW
jgi:hypothetical protein